MTHSLLKLEQEKNSYRWYLCYSREYTSEMFTNFVTGNGITQTWICKQTTADEALGSNSDIPLSMPTMAIPIRKIYPDFVDKLIVKDIINKTTDVLFMKYPTDGEKK